jgi:uncharacterized protein YjdB
MGTTTVTAISGSMTANATFTVGVHAIASVVVAPSFPLIPLGKTQQFTATATYTDGTTADVTSTTLWLASPSSVLVIDANGLAHSVGKGSFSLNATAGTQSVNGIGAVVNPVETSIQITPAAASIPKGSTQTLHASTVMSDGSKQDVSSSTSWQSSNTAVATVDSNGVVTAVSAGSAQVTGNYQAFSSSASLTITNATVKSVNITPVLSTIAKGTTAQFIATAFLSDGSTQNVSGSATWGSSASSVATVNATGLTTALAPGGATISGQFGGKTGKASVFVTAATVTSISMQPLDISVSIGGALQLHGTGTFSDGSAQNVTGSLTYSSSNTAVATVDANGVVHGVAVGTATITAALGSVHTSFQVITTTATLQGIIVTPTSVMVVTGSNQQFTATGQFSDGSTLDLTSTSTWRSSSTSVASIDALGLATGSSVGTTTIIATSAGVSGSTDVTVSPATIVSIAVSPLLSTVGVSQTQAFTAMASLSDGTSQDVTASAHWSVSNSSVAQISNAAGTTGTATARAAGTVQITATMDRISGQGSLGVTPTMVTGVSVSPSSTSITPGIPVHLSATASYSDGSAADVTSSVPWASSNGSVASVALGLVTPLTLGTSTVTATLPGHSGSATITVTPATLTSIVITTASVSPPPGLTSQLTATGTFSDGSVQNITSAVHWTSSAGAVATVSSTGLILSIASGTTSITAALGQVTQSLTINVSAVTLQGITVSASQTSVALGFTLPLTATGNYSDGSTQDLTAAVRWSSSDSTIGVINGSGELSGLLAGSFSANATSQGVTGSLAVTVNPARLVSLSISPSGPLSALLTHPMTLTGHFSDGSTQTISSGAHWSVSNMLMASITQAGVLLPLGLGNITVTASYGTLSAHATISLT